MSACLSPTLPPLPPPSEPEMHYEAAGELRLQGSVTAHRSVTVIAINNHSGAVGGRVVRDGKYSFLIEAEPGDEIELWYEFGAKVSDSLFLEAPPLDSLPDAGASGTDGGDLPTDSKPTGASHGSSTDAGASMTDAAPVEGG